MKLTYITNARIPSERANALQAVHMCAAFAEAGAEVTLYHPARRNLPQFSRADPWRYYGVPRNFSRRAVWCLDLFPFSGGREWVERPIFWLQTLTFALALTVALASSPADVYYSRDPFVLAWLALAVPAARGRVFFEAHRFPSSRPGRVFHRAALSRCSGLVAITAGLSEQLFTLSVRPERVLVAPDAVNLSRYQDRSREAARRRLGYRTDEKVAVYTGQLYEWKGADVFAEAAARLNGSVRAVIVGGTAGDAARLREHIGARGWSNVEVVGHVPPDGVPDYQIAADVLVLPNSARAEISRKHTSPMKLFEYMAAERPIVASNLPSLREVLRDGENALLVKPDDPGALAEGLRRVFSDGVWAEGLAAQARRDVQAHTWEARARRVLDFVRSGRPGHTDT